METMDEPVSASQGAMRSLPRKLESLLSGSKQGLRPEEKKKLRFLQADLQGLIDNYLFEPSEVESPASTANFWMKDVRDLSYDIDDFIYELAQGAVSGARITAVQIQKPPRVKISRFPEKLKRRQWITDEISGFRTRVREAIQRHGAYLGGCRWRPSTSSSRELGERQHSAPAPCGKAAIRLVGMDSSIKQLCGWLANDGQPERKVASIVGTSGVGKTTLAREVYRKLGGQFECRAFVQASQKQDMKMLLTSLLSQVRRHHVPDSFEVHRLLLEIKEHLQDKTYIIVIDNLWASSTWDIISHALPKGNYCSTILATTEVDAIAQTCCADTSKYIFKKEPLSEDESRDLFLSTVFGHEAGCPQSLKEVSNEIIKRSGGLPLAIIILASLLAGQPASSIDQLNYIQNSLSSDLSTNTSLEGIKQVLNLGYDNLPHGLKACMLYLCLYEEDRIIWKDDLVKQWIAEGFIHAMKGIDGKEVARSYFDELVNRGMIQPVDINCNDEILSCRVHNMVLHFIRYKSIEENFTIALDHSQTTIRLADKVRRLALHFGNVEHVTPPMLASMRLSQVRSVFFSGLLKCMPSVVEFRFIQVLILKFWDAPDNRSDNLTGSDDLSGNIVKHDDLSDNLTEPDDLSCNLTEISELFRLRYFHLDACHMSVELPTQMKRLKDLVAWEIDADVTAVPSDIVDLPGLFFLSIPSKAHLPTGIGRMTALRTLGVIDLSKNPTENIMFLGELTNLQDLRLTCSTLHPDNLEKNLEFLGLIIQKLSNLKSVTLVPAVSSHVKTQDDAGSSSMTISWHGFTIVSLSPSLLQKLELSWRCCIFSSLPEWTKDLTKLGILKMAVRKVSSADVVILKGLPSLTALSLFVWTAPVRRIIFDNEGFLILKYFKFVCLAPCLVFLDGAMPKVQNLKLGFNANRMERYSLAAAGLEHLTGLNELSTKIGGAGTNECCKKSTHLVLTDAIRKHTSTPIINVQWVDWNYCGDEENYIEASKEIRKRTLEKQGATAGESSDEHGVQEKKLEGDAKKPANIRTYTLQESTSHLQSTVLLVHNISEAEDEWLGPSPGDDELGHERDTAVEEAVRVVEQWESQAAGVRLVFESPEDAEEYLAATTCLVGLAGAHMETVLQVAMARLEEEFRQLLIRGMASLTVEDLHDFLLPRLSLPVPTPSCASSIDLDYTWTSVSDEGDKSTGWGTSSSVSDDEISPYVPDTISSLKGIVSDVMYSSSYLIFPDTVSTLKDIADVMLCAGYTTELSQVYSKVRRDTLVEWLGMLGVDKMSLEEVQMVEWASLNGKIKKWTHALKVVVRGLLAEERRICSQIFAADAGTEKECFAQVAEGCILQLLNFGLAIATGKRSPEKLFRILGMYEALAELLPELEALFSGGARDFIKNEAERILVSLGDAVRGTVAEFAKALQGDTSRRAMPGGVIHPLTRYVMDYVQLLEDHSCFLNNLLDGCQSELENVDMTPWEHCVLTLITHLLNKIEDKSKLYDDEALQKIFLMNNLLYIVQKVNDSELKTVLGDNWIRKLRGQIRTCSTGYLRSSWNRVLDCLRDDELPHTTGSPSALKDALKERFRNFNLTYEELYRTQTAWQVVDPQLREELKISISERVIPAYRLFFRRYRGQLDGVRNIVKYNPEELENQISDFFHGDNKLGHERDTAVVEAVRGVDHAVTGAMGSLIPKLGELLMDEYKLHKRVKKDICFLARELESLHTALINVGEVPRDQLDRGVKHWADEVRELSYNMEDVLDKFLVRVDGIQPHDDANRFKDLMKRMIGVFKKGKNRHRIADAIKEIKEQLQEVAARRDRNRVDVITPNPTHAVAIDPRLRALYTEATELVGIYGNRDQNLMRLLSMEGDDASNKRLKKVSIVGFGGLGKTTLARAVYEKIKGDFDCRAFVPVGQNPDIKKIFRDILIELGNSHSELVILDAKQLIDKLREFLENKRYLIIIDDIWDGSLWKGINLAFSNRNNLGSRLITTTRIFNVSESCCSSADDSIYHMEPLSTDDSRRLFYKRIFPSESGCPNEFEQVSRDILKKCGGVPLAIITIASALACGQKVKPKCEWDNLLQSLGSGLTEDKSLDEMRIILSFSYYDLPSHLRTCLLYLSIYPEGSEIDRDRLIWKWVAEGFVHCGNQGTSLYLLGLNYFNQLINRSMIQPIYGDMGEVHACRVHDMVLDLICNLSHEAKFVKLLNGTGDSMSSESNIRRLSLQNINEDPQGTPIINFMGISRVRSITIFPPAMSIMPALSRFEVLRVLDLSECDLGESSSLQINLKNVGHLIHLRYLGLANTGIKELPAELGNLQFLEVLDLTDNYKLDELPPPTLCKLRRLIFLNVHMCEVAPGVLQNLTSIEVLRKILVSLNIVAQELGNLARLRKLGIHFKDGSLDFYESFVESLGNLHHIESLSIGCNSEETSLELMDLLGELWVPPVHLREFESYMPIQLSALRGWIKRGPSHLSNLSQLILMKVKEVQQEDVEIIGALLSLRSLRLKSTHQTQRLLVIRADGFCCMVNFTLDCGSATQIVFEPGALPKVEMIAFSLGVRVAKEDGNSDFDLGLQGNLLSLRQDVCVYMYCGGARVGEAKQAEAALEHVLKAHPNNPSIRIDMKPWIKKGAQDDDIM